MQKILLSENRMQNYVNLEEYINNIRYSQNFYPVLHLFEISLINKINIFYGNKFGQNWLVDQHFLNLILCLKH